jgi:dCMP deaminase
MKRQNVLSWDDYFMGLAHLSSFRSKDPGTQVDAFPWEREGSLYESKYAYVVHAELNAILNSPRSLSGCSIYVSLFPCNECAKAIIQSGIKTIVYEDDKYADTEAVKASKRMLEAAGIGMRQLAHRVRIQVTIE